MAIEDQAQTTILAIGVDTGNSVQEFQKVSAAADKMGGVISNAADVAAAALERQGQAQEQAAKQSKRSTDAAVRTLQTEIAAREAGGRATARYYELIYANSSKVDQQAIAPLIAKYKELEAQQVAAAAASKQRAEAEKKAAQDAAAAVQAQIEAQKAATAAAAARAANAQPQRGAGVGLPDISEGTRQLEKMGMTAKATSAALRQVPAQFTDIVVSLQGGQAPLTVFLQQGGQLKDVFGGAGAAASALGKYVLGLINPLSLTVAAIAAIGLATYNASEDLKALNTVLIATGNRAGTTSGQLANIAESLSKQGFSFSQSAAALVEFARAGVNVGDRLESITRAALDLEKYGGQAVKKTAEDFASLAKDPLTASLELNKQLGYLTRGTVEYIDKLLVQGDVVKAAAVAQEAYADSARRSAEAYKANLGPIDTALNFYTEKGKKMWDALRGLVGPDTGNEQLAKLQSQLANVRSALDGQKPSLPGQESSATKELLTQEKLLLNQINYFGRVNEAAKIAGEQEGKRTRQVQLTGEWLTKYASASEKQAATEKRIRLEGIELGKTELQIQQAIAVSRGKQSAGNKAAAKVDENLRELSQYIASLEKRIDTEKQLTEVQKAQNLIAKAATNDADAQVQAYALALAAEFDLEAQKKASTAALKKYNDELSKSADSVEKTVQKYKDESAAVALAISQRISLEAAINDVNIARLEERALLEYQGGNFDGLAATQREIKLRKELAKEIRSKDVREANDKAAKSAADSWKKAADQIGDSITDALFRGFESGKGFIDNLIATTENAFKTMVLRPVVQGTVSALTNAGASALGLGAASSAAGGVAQLGGLAALGSTFGSSLAAGFSGTLTAGFTGLGATLSGGLSAIATGTASTMAAGLGQIVGALGPIGLGAAALYGLAGGFKGEYVSSTGDANVAFNALGQRTRTSTAAEIGAGRFDAKLTEGADKLVVGLNTAYLKSIKKLGATAKFTDFFFGGNTSEGGKFTLGSGVGGVGGVFNSGEQKGGDEAVKLAASRAVFAALKASDLPQYLAKVFDGIAASTATLEQIDAATNYAVSLKSIRDALTETRTPLQVLQANVDSAFTSLGTSAASFKTDFVAAIDAGISPERLVAFQELGANLDALGKAAGTTAEAARSLTEIATERANLQRELDNLTLGSADLLAKQRDALDESNRSLFDQVQAANAAKEANDAAAEAARNVADERRGLQDQLDAATLTAVELLAKQRDALDESNRSLFDQVQAANAAKEANDAAAEAARNVADERRGLQDQLDAATLSAVELLAKQRDALDESNRSLFDQVQAANAAKEANDAAAEAARNVADERRGLQDQLDAATLSAVELLNKQRNALNDSNRALFDQVQAANAAKAAVEAFNGSMSSLGGTRFDLENQLLTLQGNTGEVATRNRTADLTKLTTGITDEAQVKAITEAYDYNESLKAQIKSFGDAKAAADAAAESQSRAAAESANAAKAAEAAANSVRDAMKSIADSLLNEAARIRGDLQLASNQSYATAQARFTVTAAQAKAGDTEAAKLLPELARTLTELASTNATSANELRNVRAATAGALEDVASKLGAQFGFQTPASAAISAPQITNTMVAYQPPQVGSQAQSQPLFINTMTSAQPPSDTTGSAAQLQQLNALVMTLKADSEKLVASNDKIRLILQLVTQNGEAMLTTPA